MPLVVGLSALVVLMLAGLVLAFSWAVEFPDSVLAAAWLVFGVAAALVVIATVRESRAAGAGFFRTLGRMFKEVGRFTFWFF